jgi:hypothetical protein
MGRRGGGDIARPAGSVSARTAAATVAALAVAVATLHCGGGGDELVQARRPRGGASGAAGTTPAAGAAGTAGAAGGTAAGAAGEAASGAAGDGAAGVAGDPTAGAAGVGAAAGADAGTSGAAGAVDPSAGSSGAAGEAASGASGAGGAAGGGGSGGGEIACADAIDNDQDGQADCADPDCVGRSICLPLVPSDWTGPLTTIKRPSTVDAVPCANGLPPKRRFVTKGNPVHCSSCACGDRQGASCALASVEVATGIPGNTSCQGVSPIDVGSATCGEFTAPTDPPGLAVRASLDEVKGSCPISGGVVDNRPPVFQESYDTCPLTAGGLGCGTGTCVPLTNEAQTCIVHTGVDAFCPSGWNTRIVVFDDADDLRGCSPCTCEDPASVCGKAKLELEKAAGCAADPSASKATIDVDGTCTFLNVSQSFPGVKWHLTASGVAVTSKTCTPQGGQPQGDVSPKNGSVLCCL